MCTSVFVGHVVLGYGEGFWGFDWERVIMKNIMGSVKFMLAFFLL
jgi:hypothetical protein